MGIRNAAVMARRQPTSWLRILAAGALLSLTAMAQAQTPVQANSRGLAWLQTEVQPDGSLAHETSSVATPIQARAEALTTLAQLATAPPTLVSQVSAGDATNIDYAARRITALRAAGQDTAAAMVTLAAAQNTDGGWGLAPGYASDALDTALALTALQGSPSLQAGKIATAADFLVQNANADGGWGPADASSHYVTASVLVAAQGFGSAGGMGDVSDGALAWLVAAQTAGSYTDVQRNALGLLGLAADASQANHLQALLNALVAAQAADGSWSQDPYLTALVLRALHSATVGDPRLAGLSGRVLERLSGMSLAGASISLSGPANFSANSGADGRFLLAGVTPGEYHLHVGMADFSSIDRPLSIALGERRDLGDLLLAPAANATTAIVRGIVYDAASGQPIVAAAIDVAGLHADTDAQGRYLIVGVTPGNYEIQATATGHITDSTPLKLAAGGIEVYAPRLLAGSGGADASYMYGHVTRGDTGQGIPIRIYPNGPSGDSWDTDLSGNYSLPRAPGTYGLNIYQPGYDGITIYVTLGEHQRLEVSPVLYPEGTTPPQGNGASAQIRVVDLSTGAPLEGASVGFGINGRQDDGQSVQLTDLAGHAQLSGIHAIPVRAWVSKPGYDPAPLVLTADAGLYHDVDMGTVGLWPAAFALTPAADLRVDSVNTAAITRSASGSVGGHIDVSVFNQGHAATGDWFEAVAFFDLNGDDHLDSGDRIVGRARRDARIDAGSAATISITLAGQSNFAGAPVKVMLDADHRLNEINTWNNLASSSASCAFQPNLGSGQPVLKWHSDDTEVMNVPVVAPLLDTNGDGKVDELDHRAVLVVTFSGYVDSAGGTLRALDAATGAQLWSVDDPLLQARASGSVAVGDLDGDGSPEVVYFHAVDNQLIVLDNHGAFKWTAPYPVMPDGYNYTGPTLADLDGDGHAEILVEGAVLNSNGSLRFTYPGVGWSTVSPFAADIDGDGKQEILIGNRAYDSNGNPLWTSAAPEQPAANLARIAPGQGPVIFMVSGGFSAGTAYAVSAATGQVLWSRAVHVVHGGSNVSLGDMDGDGTPELAVVAYDQFLALRADGSTLWSADLGDDSGGTTASLFDFNGDGALDVVFGGLLELRIMDGRDGHTLYSLPHQSATAGEYSLVTDVDGDGHAELLVVGDLGINRGLSVYSAPSDGVWPGARAIWNQYHYSGDNVDDSGRIPAHPRQSWLESNTFRANTLRFGNGLPDLSIDNVAVTDQGYGHLPSLGLRVGNAGLRAPAQGSGVDAFRGDPAQGGLALGHRNLRMIAPGTATPFDFADVAIATGDTLYLKSDMGGAIEECTKANNTVVFTVHPANALADVQVTTDAPSYVAGNLLTAHATLHNTGALSNDFRVQLQVVDASGALVADLGTTPVNAVAGNATAPVTGTWTVTEILAGTYHLQALVLPSNGNTAVAQALANFKVGSATTGAALTVASRQSVYATTQAPQLNYTVINNTSNALWQDAHVRVLARNASSQIVYDHDFDLGMLTPGAVREGSSGDSSALLPVGTYTIEGSLRDGANGAVFATDQASFSVTQQADTLLEGTAQVSASPIRIDQSVTCSVSLHDRGPDALSNVPVRYGVRGLTDGVLHAQVNASVSLASGGNWNASQVVAGTSLGGGDKACVVEAQIGGNWMTIAYRAFTVQVQTNLAVGLSARWRSVKPGQVQFYRLHLGNLGGNLPASETLTLTLPPEQQWLQAGPGLSGCTVSGNQVNCPVPPLATGASVDVCVATKINAAASTAMQTQIVGTPTGVGAIDPDTSNNTVSITTYLATDLVYGDGFEICPVTLTTVSP